MVMTLGGYSIGQLLLVKLAELVNSRAIVVTYSSLSVFSAFALYYCVKGRLGNGVPTFMEFLKLSVRPIIVIALLAFIAGWGDSLFQIEYLQTQGLCGITIAARDILVEGDVSTVADSMAQSAQSSVVLVASIPPMVIGVIMIFLNKLLPLSAVAAQSRK